MKYILWILPGNKVSTRNLVILGFTISLYSQPPHMFAKKMDYN